MRKEIYLEQIKNETGINKKDIDSVINAYFELLKEKLITEGKASITNFGTFNIKQTRPHIIFSPVDGKQIPTKGIKKVFFTTSKDLLRRL